jgi:hypothetical protein
LIFFDRSDSIFAIMFTYHSTLSFVAWIWVIACAPHMAQQESGRITDTLGTPYRLDPAKTIVTSRPRAGNLVSTPPLTTMPLSTELTSTTASSPHPQMVKVPSGTLAPPMGPTAKPTPPDSAAIELEAFFRNVVATKFREFDQTGPGGLVRAFSDKQSWSLFGIPCDLKLNGKDLLDWHYDSELSCDRLGTFTYKKRCASRACAYINVLVPYFKSLMQRNLVSAQQLHQILDQCKCEMTDGQRAELQRGLST